MNYRLYSDTEKSWEAGHILNEDSYLFSEFSFMNDKKIKLMLVADGMGGLEDGDLASKNAVTGFMKAFYNKMMESYLDTEFSNFSMKYAIQDIEKAIIYGIQEANKGVCKCANPMSRTGTTLSVVCVVDDCMVAANVGDSPIYFLKKRENRLRLVSKLQTKAEKDVEMGLYERGSEAYFSNSHIVYCSLGQYSNLSKDDIFVSSTGKLEPGDIILMGSDGCFGCMSEAILHQLIGHCTVEEESFVLPQMFEIARSDKNDDQTAFMYVVAGEE